VLKFPSNLEVDVFDVTEQCKDVDFVNPLSLTEVLSQPDESFPAVVEILEGSETRSLFKCSWLPELNKNQHLVFHKKGTTAMFLLSSLKSRKTKQYFLVSQQYGGRLRRRPREFNSVYELYVASTQAPGLKVSVTRNCEEVEEEGLPALNVGDQLEIVSCTRMELPCESSKGNKQSVEALLCQHLSDPSDVDDDDDEEEQKDEEEDDDDDDDNEAMEAWLGAELREMRGPVWQAVPSLRSREIGRDSHQFVRHVCGARGLVQRLELQGRLERHTGCVNTLHFNPSGTRLASGSDDLRVVIWDWAIRRAELEFDSGHKSNVFQVSEDERAQGGNCGLISLLVTFSVIFIS